jgi:hypothetical protein
MNTARHVVRPVDCRIPPGGGTSDSMPGKVERAGPRLKNRRQQIRNATVIDTEGTIFESAEQ